MRTEFTTYTYEVYTLSDDRWTLDTLHSVEWRAVDRATELVTANQHSAVRVVSEDNKKTTRRKTIFEQECGVSVKKEISISRVDSAPPCSVFDDYYGYESRKTIGRLLRNFLDERQITPLELLYRYDHLVALERLEHLHHRAIQRIAALQAADLGLEPSEVSDKLYDVFDQFKSKAKNPSQFNGAFRALAESGFQGVLDHLCDVGERETRERQIGGALALYLEETADFGRKLLRMTELLETYRGSEFLYVIDEVIAEIIDNNITIAELLGHEPEPGIACQLLIQLSMGKADNIKNPHPCLSTLNEALAGNKLPLTKTLLIERVQSYIRSVKSLVNVSVKESREVFVDIVRALKERTGFVGGPGMSEAVTLRAKITLKHGVDDLTMPESIESILGLIPDPAIRLGYLLDLSQSQLEQKFKAAVWENLAQAEQRLVCISSLVPDPGNPRDSFAVLSGILERLEAGDYPADLHDRLSAKIEKYLRLLADSIKTGNKIVTEEPIQAEAKMAENDITAGNTQVAAGFNIFSEGDEARCAYLVKSGNVEISTVNDGTKIVLITLGPNQIFGELALLDGAPRSATATALTDCELTIVTKESLENQIESLNGFMKYWLLYLGDRIRDLTEKVEKQ